MKVIIAGSRDLLLGPTAIQRIVETSGFHVTELVSGGAAGIDRCGEWWARHAAVPKRSFLADWGAFGKSAGPRRNRQMAEYADGLIAIWNGQSRGTRNMIETMQELGKPAFVYTTEEDDLA